MSDLAADLTSEELITEIAGDVPPMGHGDIDTTILPLSRYFDIDDEIPPSQGDTHKLQTIWNHFASQAESPGDLVRLVRKMENAISGPSGGPGRLNKLYTYISILEEAKSKEQELDAYKRKSH